MHSQCLEVVHVVHHLSTVSGSVVPKHNGEKDSPTHDLAFVEGGRVVLRNLAADLASGDFRDAAASLRSREIQPSPGSNSWSGSSVSTRMIQS